MENLSSDIKHGCRLLIRNPGFTIVVILAVALGIGANTAVFSVMNAVLLKPLPYKNPDHIVSIAGRFTGIGIPDDRNQISPPELMDLRKFSNCFSDITALQAASYNIRVTDTPERFSGAVVRRISSGCSGWMPGLAGLSRTTRIVRAEITWSSSAMPCGAGDSPPTRA